MGLSFLFSKQVVHTMIQEQISHSFLIFLCPVIAGPVSLLWGVPSPFYRHPLSQPCTICSTCSLCPSGDGFPQGTWGLCRRVTPSPAGCQPRAPAPAALRLSCPEKPGCLPSPILFQANILCFPICQNRDLVFYGKTDLNL